jgi:hypothetical protein
MNRVQKAATAFIALTITAMGALLATAPLTLADAHRAMSHADTHVSQVAAQTAATLRAQRAATVGTSA